MFIKKSTYIKIASALAIVVIGVALIYSMQKSAETAGKNQQIIKMHNATVVAGVKEHAKAETIKNDVSTRSRSDLIGMLKYIEPTAGDSDTDVRILPKARDDSVRQGNIEDYEYSIPAVVPHEFESTAESRIYVPEAKCSATITLSKEYGYVVEECE